MKKTVLFLFVSTLICSCHTKVSNEDIQKLNGYWEIEKVVFPDGTQKKYTINGTFDYFNIEKNKGFRKKVMPQLDGTFLVNDTSEKVEIKVLNDKYYIFYKTDFNKWKEELNFVSDEYLILINDLKNEYHYKRAAPINLLGDGKKTQ